MGIRKGSIVKSVAVGTRRAFTGEVIERCVSGTKDIYYNVRDAKGQLWCRALNELTQVTTKVTPCLKSAPRSPTQSQPCSPE